MNQSQLDKFRREVNLNLAVGALADYDLPVTADDGGRPVVCAIESEPLSTMFGRLRAVGGYANVFVQGVDGVRMASVIDHRSALMEPSDDMTAEGERPGPGATVGMFMDWVETCPNGVKVSDALDKPAWARDSKPVELESLC